MGVPPDPFSKRDLLSRPLRDVITALASPHEAAAGGPAAAIAVSTAAALTAKVARMSRMAWVDAGGAVASVEALRAQAEAMIDQDAAAYRRARAVLVRTEPSRTARGGPTGPGAAPLPAEDSAELVADALTAAADLPLAICEIGAEVAGVAAEVAMHCPSDFRPDVRIAATLAACGAHAATVLVEANRLLGEDDPRRTRARATVKIAREAEARTYDPAP